MPTILFATSTFFDSQFALLLLTMLALFAFSFALIVSHSVITQRDTADARDLAALPDVIATLGDDASARVETASSENGRRTPPEGNMSEWSA